MASVLAVLAPDLATAGKSDFAQFRVSLSVTQRQIVEEAVRRELPESKNLQFQGVIARPLVSGWIVCGWVSDASARSSDSRLPFQVSLDAANSALALIEEPSFLVKECSRWGLHLMKLEP